MFNPCSVIRKITKIVCLEIEPPPLPPTPSPSTQPSHVLGRIYALVGSLALFITVTDCTAPPVGQKELRRTKISLARMLSQSRLQMAKRSVTSAASGASRSSSAQGCSSSAKQEFVVQQPTQAQKLCWLSLYCGVNCDGVGNQATLSSFSEMMK